MGVSSSGSNGGGFGTSLGALDDVRLAGAAADRSGGAGSSGLSRPLELLELIGEPLEPLEPCCVDTSDALGDARGFTGRVSSLPSSCDGQCWILEGDAGDEGRSIRGAAAILRNVSEFSKSCRSKPLLEICRFSHSASSSVTAFRGGVGASVLSGLTSTFTFRRPLRPLRPQRHARQQHPKPKREPRMDGSRMDPSAVPGPSHPQPHGLGSKSPSHPSGTGIRAPSPEEYRRTRPAERRGRRPPFVASPGHCKAPKPPCSWTNWRSATRRREASGCPRGRVPGSGA